MNSLFIRWDCMCVFFWFQTASFVFYRPLPLLFSSCPKPIFAWNSLSKRLLFILHSLGLWGGMWKMYKNFRLAKRQLFMIVWIYTITSHSKYLTKPFNQICNPFHSTNSIFSFHWIHLILNPLYIFAGDVLGEIEFNETIGCGDLKYVQCTLCNVCIQTDVLDA